MCNLSWTPHSNLEKDNSLTTTPVLAQRWAVWSRGEDLISYPLRNKEDNFQYGHGSQLLLCTHIGHVIILIMP